MYEIQVNIPNNIYPVRIENGLFNEIGTFILTGFQNRKALIVADSNIAPLYGDNLLKELRGLSADIYVLPAGEGSKSHNELLKLYNYLTEFGITRSDLIIALGGGVTGDLAGFAASTYLRGVRLIQIPTSLLAMVDSSIGGKVAVNLPAGKNLVGSFYHPEAVLIDPMLLKTIPHRHFADGMAEVIKYGCIRDSKLFSMLETLNNREDVMKNIEDIIFSCCSVKKEIVEKDEKENNLRMILNFGHTFGHAVEKCFQYKKYTHGEAVSIGMVFISKLSHKLGFCSKHVTEKIRQLLKKYSLPTDFPHIKNKDVFDAVVKDKKVRTNEVNLVLIEEIGRTRIETLNKDRIGGLINEILGS